MDILLGLLILSAGLLTSGALIAEIVLFVISVAYSYSQQQKMKRKAERERDARAGFNISVEGEARSLPICYGRTVVASTLADAKVKHDYTHSGSVTSTQRKFTNGLISSKNPKKSRNEFMIATYAFCQGGINAFKHLEVDDLDYNDAEFTEDNKGGHNIIADTDGGVSMSLATSNGFSSTDVFTDVAYATGAFYLNRDNPQYFDVPALKVYVEGLKVPVVTEANGVYSYSRSSTKTYTTNPAWILLDYMTAEYGGNLPISTLNLESFYNAAQLCGTSVNLTNLLSQVTINGQTEDRIRRQGKVWEGRSTGIPGRTNSGESWMVVDDTLLAEAEAGANVTFTVEGESGYYEFSAEDIYYHSASGEHRVNLSAITNYGGAAVLSTSTEFTSGQASSFWFSADGSDSLPLYECNITLDPQESVRDNIEQILYTMGNADLVFSEGQYKLNLSYVSSNSALQTDATNTFVVTDDNLVRGEINIAYPSNASKLNQCTIRYSNEQVDFKADTAIWPETDSAQHLAYLSDDNDIILDTSITVDGITDPYHAKARAKQTVMESRRAVTYEFELFSEGYALEPGDHIKFNSVLNDLTAASDVALVRSVSLTEKMTIKVEATKINADDLSWNAQSNFINEYPAVNDFSRVPPILTNGAIAEADLGDSTAYGYYINEQDGHIFLRWEEVTTNLFAAYELQAQYLETNGSLAEDNWFTVTTSENETFTFVPGNPTDNVYFRLRTISQTGQKSAWSNVIGGLSLTFTGAKGQKGETVKGQKGEAVKGQKGEEGIATKGQKGATGDNGNTVKLDVDEVAFVYDANGALVGTPTASFTVEAFGISNPYFRFFVDGTEQTGGTVNNTAGTFTYSPDSSFSNMPQIVSVKMYTDSSSSTPVATDLISMLGLKEAASIPAVSKRLTYDDLQTSNTVSSAGQWKITTGASSTPATTGSQSWTTGIQSIHIHQSNDDGSNLDYLNTLEAGDYITFEESAGNYAVFKISAIGIVTSNIFTIRGTTELVRGNLSNLPTPDSNDVVFGFSKGVDGAKGDSVKGQKGGEGDKGEPGLSAYTISIENDSHVVPVDADGNITYTGSGTDIHVYKGTNKLQGVTGTPSTGEFSVSADGDGITESSSITVPANEKFIRVGDHSVMTGNPAVVTYTINLENISGLQTNRLQTITKSIEGQKGESVKGQKGESVKGEPGVTAKLIFDDQVFDYDADGDIVGGTGSQTSNVSTVVRGITGTLSYEFYLDAEPDPSTDTPSTTNSTGTATFTAPNAITSLPQALTVVVKSGGNEVARDTVMFFGVKPGAKGDSVKGQKGEEGDKGGEPFIAVMSNPNHTIPFPYGSTTATDGNYAGSGTTIRAFQGGTELDSIGSGGTLASGKFMVTRQARQISGTNTINPGTNNYTGTEYVIGDHAGFLFTNNTDLTAFIDYTITFPDNTTQTLTQSFTIVNSGQKGQEGDSVKGQKGEGEKGDTPPTVSLTISEQVFTYDSYGYNPTNSSGVTLTAEVQNAPTGTVYYNFLDEGSTIGSVSTSATATYVPQSNITNMPRLIKVEASLNSNGSNPFATDFLRVIGVKPGADALPAISKRLTYDDLQTTGGISSTAVGQFKIDTDVAGTVSDSGQNQWSSNTKTLHLSQDSDSGVDNSTYFNTLEAGDTIVFSSDANADQEAIFTLTGAPTESGSVWTFRGTTEMTNGTISSLSTANGNTCRFGFSKGSAGFDAYTVVFSNQTHDISVNADGTYPTGAFDGSGTTIQVYKGNQLLTPTTSNPPSAGEFRVGAGTTPANQMTFGSVSIDTTAKTYTLDDYTAMTNDNVTVNFVIYLEGNTTEYLVDQTLTKVYSGAKGESVKGQKGEEGPATKGQKGEEGDATKGQKGEEGVSVKGEPANRYATTLCYKVSTNSSETAPTATITWSTGDIVIATSGWTLAPQQASVATEKVWVSRIAFFEDDPTLTSTQGSGTTPVDGFVFDGIATFINSGATLSDGAGNSFDVVDAGDVFVSGTTVIDGGNIQANSIELGSVKGQAANNDGFISFTNTLITIGDRDASGVETPRIKIGKLS